MRYLQFAAQEQKTYPVCFLVPIIRKDDILKAYVTPYGLNQDDLLVLDLHYAEGKKKTPMAEMKAYINEELVPVWNDTGAQYIVVADAEYFKALTKAGKVDPHLGYVMDCEFGPWKVIYVPYYRQIFYDPERVKAKISQGIEALKAHRAGTYTPPGETIIKYAAYPKTDEEIEQWLIRLLEEGRPLACDIEAFSLKHNTAGIGTITMCWSKEEGIAFPVDYEPIKGATSAPYGRQIRHEYRRKLLKRFFELCYEKGITLIWHSIAYDVYVLIYQLFMEHILDQEGLLYGLKTMLGHWEDTKLITYLATNSCAGNKLSLKDQAQEFSGNWALLTDDPDITRYTLDELLRYNVIDGLSTWYVYEKHWDQLVKDDQLDIYRNLFQPATVDIIQMQLTGMPVDMEEVKQAKVTLQADFDKAIGEINNSPIIQQFTYKLNEKWVNEKNAKLKKKRVTLADANETFNPNSGPQLQNLLYNHLHLPVIALTDSKMPAVDGDTLKALRNHTDNKNIIAFLDAMIDYGAVNKILTAFIPALESAVQGPDGWHYLFGNFNLGGTLSGRLSSSNPNLQNLPATGTKYAKIIKKCFAAPPGKLFVGLDFASLEDRISALTTKDPNKLKVYTDGYDGHSLRAYSYFKEQMPTILQSEGRRVFKITQGNGEQIYLFSGDLVTLPSGEVKLVEELVS